MLENMRKTRAVRWSSTERNDEPRVRIVGIQMKVHSTRRMLVLLESNPELRDVTSLAQAPL